MKSAVKILALALIAGTAVSASADPLLTSWQTGNSGQYARIYLTKEAAKEGTAVATWDGQTLPAYSDIQRVEYSQDWVFINTTGLASHLMGPWYFDEEKTNLFNNMPANLNTLTQLPRNPREAQTKEINQLGSLGLWVNGVSLFNMLDGAFYDNGSESQDGGQGTMTAYWVRNAMFVEVVTFDNTNGHQPGSGSYHYHADPKALRFQLGDNVRFEAGTGADNAGVYFEDTSDLNHSPILGWAYDGYPIYGPYGYDNPDVDSVDPAVRRMDSGFVARDGNHGTVNLAETGRVSLAKWSAEMRGLSTDTTTYTITDTSKQGPAVNGTHVIGYWIEDFAYLGDLGFVQGVDFDLDVYNGRFCRTPEYPNGTYAYFVTIDDDGQPAFPYAIGRQWYGEVNGSAIDAITEETVLLVQAGPEADPQVTGVNVNASEDTITLAWSSVEGGQYTISSTSDFQSWAAVGDTVAGSANSSEQKMELPADAHKFYSVSLQSLADYDSEGSAGAGGPGGGGPPGGGGGAQPGTGNPVDGYVFSFGDLPPQQNLAQNIRVGTESATVINYFSQGPQGGTITLSFDDSKFTSGTPITATFSHQPPGSGLTVETSTNAYTKP